MAATEIYTNNATTTVTSGGTDAPAQGTQEAWTVASSATFPAATTGVSQFHVGDPAAPSELIAVTNVSSNAWTVTRGAESTTPVTHAAGFTVDQVITAGGLNGVLPTAGGTMSGTLVMNGSKITSLANGSGTADAMAFGQQVQVPGPTANQLLAWCWDICTNGAATGTQGSAGTLYLTAFTLYYPTTLSKIWWVNTTAGGGAVANESQVGIYSSGGTLVASATPAVTATALAATGTTSAALSATYAAAAGTYWVGMVFQAGTMPTILRNGVNNGNYVNIGISSAFQYRVCVNGTGITTALPATINTLSNSVSGSQTFWAAVS